MVWDKPQKFRKFRSSEIQCDSMTIFLNLYFL